MEEAKEPPTPRQGHWATLRHLWGYVWPKRALVGPRASGLRVRVALALLCLGVAKLVNVGIPFLLRDAINALDSTNTAVILPVAAIIAYGAARVGAQLFGELRDLLFVRVAQFAQRTIGLRTFEHLHQLPLDFHLARRTGDVSRVIERGVRGIQFVLSFMTFNIVPVLIELLLVTGILLYNFRPVYGLIVAGTIVAYVAATLWVTEWRLKYRRKMNSSESEANAKAIDSLLNYETVKYFAGEAHEIARFDTNLARYEKAAVNSQRSLAVLNLAQSAIIGSGLIAVMILAGQDVVAGDLGVGDFVLVNTFLIQLYLPLGFLGFVYREMKQSLVDADKMFELLAIESTVKDAPDSGPLKVQQGRIEFRNITFGYNDERTILKDVSFTVEPGQTLAVVGPSGSGKSTILRLLLRFYDTKEGAVLIDGVDIRDVQQRSIRAAIGVVPQDTVLFNDTIGYNIAYGDIGASQEQVEAAAKAAQVAAFIDSLPEGYDTRVGERGLKLSGGEKQRIAIARTILKAPRVLLFDEATSALDSHTEKGIQDSLDRIAEDRTTIVIAHRLSTIVGADQILVLDGGRLAEKGTHEELVAAGGRYASMWATQQEASEHEAKLRACRAQETLALP